MALKKEEADWIVRFTAGAVHFDAPEDGNQDGGGAPPEHDEHEDLKAQLRLLRDKEEAAEQALKDMLLDKAVKQIEKRQEQLRKTAQVKVLVNEDGNRSTQDLTPESGSQVEGFDTGSSMSNVEGLQFGDGKRSGSGPTDAPQKSFKKAEDFDSEGLVWKKNQSEEAQGLKALGDNVAWVMAQVETLTKVSVKRSKIVDGKIEAVEEPLFDDKEIGEEIFTPLVRDKVLGETLVPNKYSKTQQMLDGSDDFYIKECKEKGQAPGTGIADLAKGSIAIGASVADAVFSGMGAVQAGQEAMNHANWSSDQVREYTDVTNGIAAVLEGGIDLVDKGIEARKSGKFDTDAFAGVLSSIGAGIGNAVGGGLQNSNLGGMIAASIDGSVALVAMGVKLKQWADNPSGPPPIADLFATFGQVLADELSALSNVNGLPTDQANALADSSSAISGTFKVLSKGIESNVLQAIQEGRWSDVMSLLETLGTQTAEAVDASLVTNPMSNNAQSLSDSDTASTAQSTFNSGVEGMQDAVGGLTGLVEDSDSPLKTKQQKMIENGAEKLAELQKKAKELKEAAAEKEAKAIEEQLAAERKEYEDSLKCLGSTNPGDAEYKTIAKLIAQIERDRAIWDGLTAMFGAGIGVASGVTDAIATIASHVAPPLKAAGQLVKFVTNLKAAADRCSAWLDWREGRKDAMSAVSPYATSIENFIQNQGSQFAHYSIQAAANAINALLAAGEMSPLAPAFTAASAGVTAAALLEDTLYKFKKQQDLRKAWRETKKAIDPANKNNRKMRLLARKLNPTLAKYTIAYGAIEDQDPIAITAMNRIGLDRETLTRESDGVNMVKAYLETLYPDDGAVLVKLAFEATKTKVPDPKLDSKTWQLSYSIWAREANLDGGNPPGIVGGLSLVEIQRSKVSDGVSRDVPKAALQQKLIDALNDLNQSFLTYEPKNKEGKPLDAVKEIAGYYADLAAAEAKQVEMEIEEPEPTKP